MAPLPGGQTTWHASSALLICLGLFAGYIQRLPGKWRHETAASSCGKSLLEVDLGKAALEPGTSAL